MLDKLTADDFRAQLNSTFRVILQDDEQTFDIELIEVTELQDHNERSEGQRKPFSLIFRGPEGLYIPQQIYVLKHEEMGSLELFLVPIRPDEKGTRVQAIFN